MPEKHNYLYFVISVKYRAIQLFTCLSIYLDKFICFSWFCLHDFILFIIFSLTLFIIALIFRKWMKIFKYYSLQKMSFFNLFLLLFMYLFFYCCLDFVPNFWFYAASCFLFLCSTSYILTSSVNSMLKIHYIIYFRYFLYLNKWNKTLNILSIYFLRWFKTLISD